MIKNIRGIFKVFRISYNSVNILYKWNKYKETSKKRFWDIGMRQNIHTNKNILQIQKKKQLIIVDMTGEGRRRGATK